MAAEPLRRLAGFAFNIDAGRIVEENSAPPLPGRFEGTIRIGVHIGIEGGHVWTKRIQFLEW